MAVIDDKVVAMSFESSKFESGVNKTLSALDKLKASLHFPSAGKGLDDMNAAAKRVDLGHIARGVEDIRAKLGYLSVAALAVFAQIAQKAVASGAALVKAFTIDPMKAGFREYSTNLNAVQTILANTQASGAGIKEVNAALDELNAYSDKTIYNFGQMARNIGTFTAAGVDLKTATASIKGIANLAALSGSSAEQASTAMYQLSQAISSGSVKLMDWNSVVNAGMGGTVFQRALAMTGENMGKLKKGTVELVGPMKNVKIAGESFRNSLSAPGKDGWLTSDVLTTTLKMLTGDMTNAELRADGWNESQIKAIQQQAKAAMLAATNVKTLSQVLDVAKESAGSGWAKTWQIIFGDFNEAKKTFTALSNAINGIIIDSAQARNNMLGDWKALGGRTLLIESISTAFHNLGLILKPIKQAFRDIFPAKTGKDLYNLTVQFSKFAKALKPSEETMVNLRRTFRGLFAVLDIGKQIISGIFTVFGKLFGVMSEGSGGFLAFTARIGDFLVAIDQALKKGNRLHNFFAGLGTVLAIPLKIIQQLAGAIADLFSGFSPGGFSTNIDGMTGDLIPFEAIINSLVEGLQNLGAALGNAAANMNFEAILQVIRTGLFASLVLMFKNFFGKGSFLTQISEGFGNGIIGNISSSFNSLSGTMKGMQNNLRAKTLKEIAIAIALLAASLLLLSLIDPKKMNSALGAMTILFAELLGAMAILNKIAQTGGFIKLPIIIAGLMGLGVAIGLLTLSVLALSRLSWNELLRGLTGVGGLLGIIAVAIKPLGASSGGLIRAGLGIIAIAIALKILASAMADFASMNWTELSKGLISVAAGLGIIAAAAHLMPTGMILMGAGLIAVAVGLKILADAVQKFGAMNWTEIGKGLAGIGGSLLVIAGAMQLMPMNLPITAAGLILVSLALGKIADAVITMGGMSIHEIAKGLGTLAGSLVILAGALYLMSGTLGGAAALSVAATGIALLAPALVTLGKQSWGQIIKSMVTLAAALAILGVAGLVLGPVVPALLGLGAALVLIGGGLALAGAGVFLIGAGLAAIAVAGPMAIGILIAALIDLTEATGEMGKNLVLGLLEIVEALSVTAPKFVDAIIKILDSLIEVIIKSTPKIAEAFTVLLAAGLKVLGENQDDVIAAGFSFLLAFLQGIRDNISQITVMVASMVVTFLDALAVNLGKIVTAGLGVLVALLKGIGNNLARVALAAVSIVTKFISAIMSGLGAIPAAGLAMLTKFLSGIAKNLKDVIAAASNVILKFIEGLGKLARDVVTAGTRTMIKFIEGLSKNSVAIANAAGQAIVDFLRGLRMAINTYAPQIQAESAKLGFAIIDGMTGGLLSKAAGLYKTAENIARTVLGKLGGIFKINSPSKETMAIGASVMQGLTMGMDGNASQAYNSAVAMSNGVINAFKNTFKITSPSKVMMEIGQFVGQGFAQGLRGSQDDIRSSFAELNSKLTEAMTTARETIASEQSKLDKLREAKKPDAAAIKAAQATIAENQAILERSTATHKILVTTLKSEKTELIGLAKEYETIGTKLSTAKDKLAQLRQERTQAIEGFSDQYSTLPAITMTDAEGNPVDAVAMYEDALKNQTDAVAAYNATLQQLRKLGLNDATYEKLLAEGTADQAFATQLLAGGKTAVNGLNKLEAQLEATSKRLGTNAANNLKQAGIDAAEGLVKGLQSKHNAIRREMEIIAREMLAALRKELQSKSPSKKFADIGEDSMIGLAMGFSKGTKIVTDAVDDAAKNALAAMKRSMRNLSDVVMNELNPNPTITPILDLTQVRSQAKELSTLTTPITADASYAQAIRISDGQNVSNNEELAAVAAGTSVKFEQNNYSPEALSNIEIYRQTRNQLSQLKSVLAAT